MNVIRVLKPNPTRVFHDIQNGTSKDLELRVKYCIASLNQFWNISDLDCKFCLSLFIISLIIFRRKAIYLMVFKERIGGGSVISRYHSLTEILVHFQGPVKILCCSAQWNHFSNQKKNL